MGKKSATPAQEAPDPAIAAKKAADEAAAKAAADAAAAQAETKARADAAAKKAADERAAQDASDLAARQQTALANPKKARLRGQRTLVSDSSLGSGVSAGRDTLG